LYPCAAKGWNVSPDQRVFTIHLRPGLKFSTGRDVVASDYIYALERILNPATGSGNSTPLRDIRGAKDFVSGKTNRLGGVLALSSLSFRVVLENPDPTFPYNLQFTAMPREEIAGQEEHYSVRPVCTGPYMVEEWIHGARLKLTQNPHYQGPKPQYFDGVELLIGGDESTHLMMFERGELDVSNGIPRASFHRLSEHPRWRDLIQRIQLFETHCLILNTEITPLDNKLVRRAINHAIDRDRRMEVASGFYTHAEGAIPPIMPGYDPGLRGYSFDPEQARNLLHQTGLPLPLHTQLWHDTSDGSRTLAQGIQWDLKQAGIETELVVRSVNELLTASTIRGKVSMTLTGWFASLPDPRDMLGTHFAGRAFADVEPMNQSFYNNPDVNDVLDRASLEINWQKRFKLYQQAEKMIVADAPWVFLGHGNGFALRQPWIKGQLMDPFWLYRFDRIWFEK
jgi:oligopeptide transport system substrate-binding protein